MFTRRWALYLIFAVQTAFATQFGDIPVSQTIGAISLTNDTNVTLTIGGTSTDAVLKPFTITAGWTGTLAVARGGTGSSTAGAALTALGAQPLDGDLTSLAAASGTNTIYYRSAADTWSAVTIGGNMTFAGGTLNSVAGGSGNVSNSGTPTLDQTAVWTDATHIKGVTTLKGGTTGQILKKNSNTDYDYLWGSAGGTGTVTNTAGALALNVAAFGNGGNDLKTVSALAHTPPGKFTVGIVGSTVGSLDFANATSGTVTIQPTTGALGSVTMTLPAANSNPVIPDTGAANNFITGISSGGVITKAQPSFANLSSSASKAQLPATAVYTDQANTFGAFAQAFQGGANFSITDTTDLTKKVQFSVANVGTGTTQTVNIPNAASTTVQANTGAANNFLTAISAQGVVSRAQPLFADISGTATNAQLPATISSKTLDNTNTYVTKDGANFTIQNTTTTTKQAQFDLSNITAANTRTVNIPDAASTTVQTKTATASQWLTSMSGQGVFTATQPAFTDVSGTAANGQIPATLSSKTLDNTNTLNIKDTLFTLQDDAGATKQAQFQLSNISAGQTRSVNVPDANSTTIQPDTGAANNFITAVSAQGVISKAQPLFTNLSGTATKAQIPATAVYTDQVNTFGAFAQTFQGGTNFSITDTTDLTKKVQFDVSNVATASTRTVNVPNANSTTVQPDTGASNNYITGISAQGVISKTQPNLAALGDVVITAPSANNVLSYDSGTSKWKNVAPSGGGNVSNVATPTADQVAIWTGSTTIKGVTALTGGTTSQVLKKNSATDYDWSWGAAGSGSQTPWTANVDANGFNLLVTDATGIKSNETGNPELLLFTSVASAVNELTIQNAVTGSPPQLTASGSDTNIDLYLAGKGTGVTYVQGLPFFNDGFGNITAGSTSGAGVWMTAIGRKYLGLSGDSMLTWCSGTGVPNGTIDLGLARNASGVVEINNGTAGTLRDLTLRNLTISGTCTGCGGGGGSPGGSTTQVQYNNAGAFGGIANATTDGTTLAMTSPKITTGIVDTNANRILGFSPGLGAVNNLTLANNSTSTIGGTIGAEGTGTNLDIRITPKGTGKTEITAGDLQLASTTNIDFSTDTGIGRDAANTVQINNGTAGSYAGLKADVVNAVSGFRLNGTATNGKILIGNGTNLALSSPTWPTAVGGPGKLVQSDGTNFVASTPNWPTSAGTAGAVVQSNGTNFVASNIGAWENVVTVSGSDATTTGQTLVDVTGLITPTLTNSTKYEFEAILDCSVSAVTTGNQYAITGNGTGGAAVLNAVLTGTTTGTTMTSEQLNTSGTASTARLLTSAQSGMIIIRGFLTTRGSGTATISVQHLKVTSGTSTVKIGSILRYRKA